MCLPQGPGDQPWGCRPAQAIPGRQLWWLGTHCSHHTGQPCRRGPGPFTGEESSIPPSPAWQLSPGHHLLEREAPQAQSGPRWPALFFLSTCWVTESPGAWNGGGVR